MKTKKLSIKKTGDPLFPDSVIFMKGAGQETVTTEALIILLKKDRVQNHYLIQGLDIPKDGISPIINYGVSLAYILELLEFTWKRRKFFYSIHHKPSNETFFLLWLNPPIKQSTVICSRAIL